jgi:TolA-binding protein
MDKKLTQALGMYENVMRLGLPNSDYALFQKAIISGASNRSKEKVQLLESLEQRYPNSNLIADAQLEIANTYLADENFREAINPLERLLRNKNAESLYPQGYLKLGVSHYNLNNNPQALEAFKKLISGYPNSEESDAAIEYVRSIFVENGQPGEFVTFMRNNGKTITYSEEDSLTYASAQIQLQNKNTENAMRSLQDYLKKFPDGRYAIDANFFIADIYNTKKDHANALTHYSNVAAKAPNKYAEQSILQAARISYFELKDYAKAELFFTQLRNTATTTDNKLEAMRGLLRVQYRLNKWSEAVPNAQELLQQKGVATDDKMMANMILAKSSHQNNQLDMASSYYKNVVSLGKSEYAAEARYRIAEILLVQNKLPEAEKAAFDVVNKAGSYDYWITKAYILLGDVYFAQKDYFNAEATLKSVVDNSNNAELKTEAQTKLDKVRAEKNKNSKVE